MKPALYFIGIFTCAIFLFAFNGSFSAAEARKARKDLSQVNHTLDDYHFRVSNKNRRAKIYLPAANSKPAPVVFYFHGAGGDADGSDRGRRFQNLWQEAVIVYAEGLQYKKGDPSLGWRIRFPYRHTVCGEEDDLIYIDSVMNHLKRSLKVDEARIFASGHSSGAFFTLSLMEIKADLFKGFALLGAYSRYKVNVKVPGFDCSDDRWTSAQPEELSKDKHAAIPRPVYYLFGALEYFDCDGPNQLRSFSSSCNERSLFRNTVDELLIRNGCEVPKCEKNGHPCERTAYFKMPDKTIYYPENGCGAPVHVELYFGGHGWSECPNASQKVIEFFKNLPPATNPQGTAKRMDYRDVSELNGVLQNLADNSRHAQLVNIGVSLDHKSNPKLAELYPIYALRVSSSINENIGDDYQKNSILFEAGMHPREWLATESTLMLAEYLVEHAEDVASFVPEMLSKVDVWLIPLSNPSGRAIDDRSGGDPRRFSRAPNEGGWRGNGDIRGCEYGVNVARNFSSGWDSVASTDCTDDPDGSNDDIPDNKNSDAPRHYRGFAPFSSPEAAALRQFVQNHSISMAVVVHSNAEKIWNLWQSKGDMGGRGICELAEFSWRIYQLDDPNLALSIEKVGGGFGQFSGWLSDSSDVAGQPDIGTMRSIQTIYIELPFQDSNYTCAYGFKPFDQSNAFHPSGEHVRDLIRRNFIQMAIELIYQSRSPGCPTVGGAPQKAHCPANDFGLVGAKIGGGGRNAGQLTTNPAGCLGAIVNGVCDQAPVSARDFLRIGKHNVYFRIQNFGDRAEQANADVRLTLLSTIHRLDGDETSTRKEIMSFSNLSVQEAQSGSFQINVDRADADYTVMLEVRPAGGFKAGGQPDDFNPNDKKVFKFRAISQ